jgi:hypothetical protein
MSANLLTIKERRQIINVLSAFIITNKPDYVLKAVVSGGNALEQKNDSQLFATYENVFGQKHLLDPTKEDRESSLWIAAYEIGRTWNANWMPGGPMLTYQVNLFSRDEDIVKKCRQSVFEHEQYHHGFKAGLDERLKDPKFAQWWFDNHGLAPKGYAG